LLDLLIYSPQVYPSLYFSLFLLWADYSFINIIFLMEGIIYHTRSFSVHDGGGIRKAIFFKGCPLQCIWCHNPESQSFEVETMHKTQKLGDKSFTVDQTVGRVVTVNEIMKEIRADIPFFDESGGGVTLTGGEPLAQPQFAIALLKTCKQEDIHTAVDTCGYAILDVFEQAIPFTDVFLFDIKLANNNQHKRYTGMDNQLILNNLRLVSSKGKNITIRIPLVEGITDTEQNIEGIKLIIKSLNGVQRIDLLPYHSLAKHKFLQCNRDFELNNMDNYSIEKATEIAKYFNGLAPIVSVGG
jgi:pyruvate formate lyase activating enzyme